MEYSSVELDYICKIANEIISPDHIALVAYDYKAGPEWGRRWACCVVRGSTEIIPNSVPFSMGRREFLDCDKEGTLVSVIRSYSIAMSNALKAKSRVRHMKDAA